MNQRDMDDAVEREIERLQTAVNNACVALDERADCIKELRDHVAGLTADVGRYKWLKDFYGTDLRAMLGLFIWEEIDESIDAGRFIETTIGAARQVQRQAWANARAAAATQTIEISTPADDSTEGQT